MSAVETANVGDNEANMGQLNFGLCSTSLIFIVYFIKLRQIVLTFLLFPQVTCTTLAESAGLTLI